MHILNIEKYNGIENLDLAGWHMQLKARYHIKNAIEKIYYVESMTEKGHLYDLAIKISEDIYQNPLINKYYDNDDNIFMLWREEKQRYPFNTYSVSNITAGMMYKNILNQFPEILEACRLEYEGQNTPLSEELADTPYNILMKDAGIENQTFYTLLRVNLEATDKQLLEDFEHWLHHYRTAMNYTPPNKNFMEKKVEAWVTYKVLPYLDLVLINKFHGFSLTYEKLAELLVWDDDIDDSLDRIRKTTKKHADELMDAKTLAAIEAQLASAQA
jgi:hypothetical protein